MIARARKILERFPAHLEAARDGKRLGEVTQALVVELEALNAELAGVRRSHRLLEAGEHLDLMRIGALHAITGPEMANLVARYAAARNQIEAATDDDEAAEALIATWAVAEPAPRLPRFGTAEEDPVVLRRRLVDFATRALTERVLLDAMRRRIRTIAAIHARGNGTVRALITGAANALDLDVLELAHHSDRYLHAGVVRDRLRLGCPRTPEEIEAGQPAESELTPASERIVIEENPRVPDSNGPVVRKHAELFNLLRRGFERSILRIRIEGLEDRTVSPMLVNRDEGHGVGFAASIPAGESVEFTEEGRVLLDSADVTSQAFAWKGACFAESAPHPLDFVFDGPGADPGRVARFAEATPEGALDSDFTFPHAGDSLPMPGISLGETRFAFFAGEAHTSRLLQGPPESVEWVAPRTAVGFLDLSVFAPGPSEQRRAAASVTLEWMERRAFFVNVWIPERFRRLTPDDEEGRATRDSVAFALNRFRPAGVGVAVEFLDDRWVLGRGVVPSADAILGDEVLAPGTGSELWNAPTE